MIQSILFQITLVACRIIQNAVLSYITHVTSVELSVHWRKYDLILVSKFSNNPAFCARQMPKPKPAYQTNMKIVNFVFIDFIRSFQDLSSSLSDRPLYEFTSGRFDWHNLKSFLEILFCHSLLAWAFPVLNSLFSLGITRLAFNELEAQIKINISSL